VVPFTAGGSADLIGRLLAQHMQAKYNIPFVIENRGGAGAVGTGRWRRRERRLHAADRTVSTHAINPSLYARLPFDVERDFAPVTNLVRLPNLLVVNNSVPARACPSWSPAQGERGQGELRIVGQRNVIASLGGDVQIATGTKMTHVPFRSTSER